MAREHPWLVGCNFVPEHGDQPARDVAGRHLRPGRRSTASWAGPRGWASTASACSSTTCSGSRTRTGFLDADGPVPGDRRPAPDRRDVRAVRRRLGPVPRSSASSAPRSRACTTRAGSRAPAPEVLADPARHDALKGYVTGVVGRFKRRPPGPRLGPVQRAGQPQPLELRPARAGRTSPSWRWPCSRRRSPGRARSTRRSR